MKARPVEHRSDGVRGEWRKMNSEKRERKGDNRVSALERYRIRCLSRKPVVYAEILRQLRAVNIDR